MTVRERIAVWRKNPVIDLAVTIVLAIAIAYGVQAWIVKPFRIPSESMVPTLEISDRVLTARFMYRLRDPERGDIVVFYPNGKGGCDSCVFHTEPGAQLPPGVKQDSAASTPFVKRLVGLPGETIGATGGKVYICRHGVTPDFTEAVDRTDGCRFLDEPYVSSTQETFGPLAIPAGHYFMMGDNRANSADSRYWGPVARSHLIGPAFARYWPITRIGIV